MYYITAAHLHDVAWKKERQWPDRYVLLIIDILENETDRIGWFEPCDLQEKSDMEVLVIVLLIFFSAAEEA